MTTIAETWNRIEGSLASIAGALAELGSGCAPNELDAAASILGVALPLDFCDSYAIHNGQAKGILFVCGEYRLWPIADVVANWKVMQENPTEWFTDSHPGTVKECVFNPRWIGFADNGGASVVALDLDLGDAGSSGQVIVQHEDGVELLAPSYAMWLEQLAEELISGALRWNEVAGQFDRAD